MAFCLIPPAADRFIAALKDGRISPDKLTDMSSDQRRQFLGMIVGPDNAEGVNALLESKLLLKDQQRGMIAWAQQVGGLKDPVRSDLVDRINKLDRVLNPTEERAFLADYVAQKLGAAVTRGEARQISALSQKAEAARQTMLKDMSNANNRRAFGRALIDMTEYVNSLKPEHTTLADILNVPKTSLTSILHLSAPFVQGWGMMSTRRGAEAFGHMLTYFGSEENYKNLIADIIAHPDYQLAKGAKLGLTDLSDKLTSREEAIQSTLIEKANQWLTDKTHFPNLVRASNRAFTGYLNYVRFNRFVDLLNAARNRGEDVRPGSRVVRDLANVVNDFTGRANLGPNDRYSGAGPILNALFFAPRKVLATVNMFNPVRYIDPRISPTARIAATRQLVGSLLATGAVLGLAQSVGAKVDWDPRSSNFAKIQIGNIKLDITGSNDTWIRLLARLAKNQQITSKGKLEALGEHHAPVRGDLVLRYIRGKLSPIASTAADFFAGTDMAGRRFSIPQEIQDKFVPIVMSSFVNYAENDPHNWLGVVASLTAIFGVGVETPSPPISHGWK